MKNLLACFVAVTFVVTGYAADKSVTLVGKIDFATGKEQVYKITDRDQGPITELLSKKTKTAEEEQKRIADLNKALTQVTSMKSNLVTERTLEKETATIEKKESKNSGVVVSNDEGKEIAKGKQACCGYRWGWGGCGPRWGCGWRPAPIFWGGCGGGCNGWFPPQVIVMPQWGVQPVFPMGGCGGFGMGAPFAVTQPGFIAPQTTVVTGPNGGTAVVNQGTGFQVY